MKTPEPGLHRDIPDDHYHRWQPAVNASLLKVLREQTEAHALEYLNNPPDETDAMRLGTATHLACLEPQYFKDRVIVGLDHDRRSNANKAAWLEFEAKHDSKIILKQDAYDHCLAMKEAVLTHPRAAQFLDAPGMREVSMVWEDPETGVVCKARPDILCRWQDWNCIVDVKTIAGYTPPTPVMPKGTGGASTHRIESQIAGFSYDMQAAFYLRGANALAPAERRFIFIFVEKTAPYGVHVCEPTSQALFDGAGKCQLAIRKWATALETGQYPAYGNEITQVGLPKYAGLTEEELEEVAA